VLDDPESRRLIKATYQKEPKLEERELRRLRLTDSNLLQKLTPSNEPLISLYANFWRRESFS
jgi:hypothetical protein